MLTVQQANTAINAGDQFWVEPYRDGDVYLVERFDFDDAGILALICMGAAYAFSARRDKADGEVVDVEITF